jgi:hypothetical protein
MLEPHKLSTNRLYALFEREDADGHAALLVRLIRDSQVGVGDFVRWHPLGDDWMDFAITSLATYFSRVKGHVYIAQTPQYPEIFKVGKTARPPDERIAELNNEAVLIDFRPIKVYCVHDRHRIERDAHKRLTSLKIPRLKEFFKAPALTLDLHITNVIAEDLRLFEQQGFSSVISQRSHATVP